MSRAPSADAGFPAHVVALGGGTGLPAVLRGLRALVTAGRTRSLTAVVTMTDDGGSSGRLRRSRGLPPPGDVRNCLVALAAEEDLLSGLFQHRYLGGEELDGHNLGNLILAALAEQTGSFLRAVEVSSRVLRTVGRILPATLEDVRLEATLEDGATIVGETSIAAATKRCTRISLRPATAQPTPGVVEAILDADLVVLGPGSLFTSLLPNLVFEDVARALRSTTAVRVLVGNLVSEPDETAGIGLTEHLRLIETHAGSPVVDALVANSGAIAPDVLRRYLDDGAEPLVAPRSIDGLRVVHRDLVAGGAMLRHDPGATADALVAAWRRSRRPARLEAAR